MAEQFLARCARSMTAMACISLTMSIVVPDARADVDCRKLYAAHLQSDLTLGYQAFDQTEGQGFRSLDSAGCTKEAADLIEEYIRINQADQRSLRWHIAQVRATQGDTVAAIRYARTVLMEHEDFTQDPLRWNDYVLATIAFLEKDKAALLLHRNRVAEGKSAYWGNALNLKLLDSLIRNFDRDYRYATSHIEDS